MFVFYFVTYCGVLYEMRINMDRFLRVDNNIIAIIVSLFVLANLSYNLNIKDKKNQIFILIFKLNLLVLIIETSTCLINKLPFLILQPFDFLLHMLLFILSPFVPLIWCYFIYCWISDVKQLKRRDIILFMLPAVINAIFVMLNPVNKLIFCINNNVYERKILFFIPAVATTFYFIFSIFYTYYNAYYNKKKINKLNYKAFMLLAIFPVLCAAIQCMFYNFFIIWSSIAYTLIIIYINLQQRMIHLDYLTGASSRESLYILLNNNIERSNAENFALAFMDFDNFKYINDNYGHAEGDEALKTIVRIVNNVLSDDDFITRYGGDEFVLFLKAENEEMVQNKMHMIENAFYKYNKLSGKKYKLEYSYGFKMYDYVENLAVDEFISHIDDIMYKEKKSKKLMNNRGESLDGEHPNS